MEEPVDRPRTSFADGVVTGIAAAAVLLQLFLAWELGSFTGMYKDLGGQVPAATRIVLATGWRLGLPVGCTAAIVALVVRRPRASWPYLVAGVVIVALTVATWWFARAPLYELAGNIRAD